MAGVISFAMFIGALSAVGLVFSGWSAWIAMNAYIVCGIFELLFLLVIEFFLPLFSIGYVAVTKALKYIGGSQVQLNRPQKPRRIAALSEESRKIRQY